MPQEGLDFVHKSDSTFNKHFKIMETNLNTIPDPFNVSYRQQAIRAGLILAVISIFIGLITYVGGLTEMILKNQSISTVINFISFGIALYVIYDTCIKHRQQDLGGYISLGRCIGIGTLSGLVSGLIYGVWAYLFMSVIAPELMDQIINTSMEKMAEKGLSETEIEAQMKIAAMFFTPTAFAIISLVSGVFSNFLAGLLVGLVVKKERPFAK